MKKYIKYLIISAIVPVAFSSCLKDDELIGPDADGAVTNVIEFKNIAAISSGPTAPYALYVPSTLDPEVDETTINAIVRYAGVNDAPEDITVTIEAFPAAIDTYNEAEETDYHSLSASSYEVPTTVTIKKGEREALVPIKLKTSTFDQSISNALSLRISSASSSTPVSGNFGTVIYSFPVKSIWEGTYTYTITNNYGTIDANIGGTFTEEGVQLSTVGPNRLYMQYLWRTYSGYAHYQFSGDNTTITAITAFSGSARPTVIDQIVIVDAENKIFEIRWTCLGRGVVERFVRTGD